MQNELIQLTNQLNLELQQPGSKLPVSGDENRFIDARNDAIVNYAPVERLKEVLRLAMVKVGLRAANWPNEEEKGILIAHITNNYGKHTVTEIILAFDMAIAGKLNVEVNCYENFSCLYFSTIMNAYRVWASQTHFEIKIEKPKELPVPKLTDSDMFEWLEETKIKFEKGEIIFNFLPVILYEFLYKKKLINPGAEIWEAAKKKRISEIQNELCNPHSEKNNLNEELKYLKAGIVDKENSYHLPARLIAQRLSILDYLKIINK